MPFSKSRNSRDDNSKRPRNNSDSSSSNGGRSRQESSSSRDKSTTGNRSYSKPGFDRNDRGASDRPFGKFEKKDDKSSRPFSKRSDDSSEKRSFDGKFDKSKKFDRPFQKPFGAKSDQSEGRKSFDGKFDRTKKFDKPFQKSFGAKSDQSEGRKSFDGKFDRTKKFDKPFQKSYGSKSEEGEGRKPFDNKFSGSKSFDKPFQKSYGSKSEEGEGRKTYDNKSSGSKSFDKPFQKSYGSKSEEGEGRKTYDNKSSGSKSFDKPFQKSYGSKSEEGEGRKPYGSKYTGSKSHDRPFRNSPGGKFENTYASEQAPERKFVVRKKASQPSTIDDGLIRLNRYIANSGVCSRRKADELIESGVVSVNGVPVSELGTRVDPAKDEIKYNGERLKREKMVYVLLNKPKDYITTTDDPQERRTVMQLVEKATKERIYPVGRLDRNTTGLLLMTNDGNLAEKLSHPRNSISKLYNVELDKSLSQGDFNKIQVGIELEDGVVKPDDLSYVLGATKKEVGIQIHSGKNRIVRRIFESLGYEVVKLDRVVYANLTKKDLPRGRWRYIDERELVQLKHLMK